MKLPLLEPYKHVLPPDEFGTQSQLLAELGRGCEPIAVMLTCWELGWVPDQVSRANSGELFIVQNPGGLLPAADMDDDDIQTRLRQGLLFLHGWIRDDETSSIIAYNPVVGPFCDSCRTLVL